MSDELGSDPVEDEKRGMTLARASWSITGLVFFITGVILLIEGYIGYAIVTLVIGLAAAINLLRWPGD